MPHGSWMYSFSWSNKECILAKHVLCAIRNNTLKCCIAAWHCCFDAIIVKCYSCDQQNLGHNSDKTDKNMQKKKKLVLVQSYVTSETNYKQLSLTKWWSRVPMEPVNLTADIPNIWNSTTEMSFLDWTLWQTPSTHRKEENLLGMHKAHEMQTITRRTDKAL